jgi:anti-sigma factor RsiW
MDASRFEQLANAYGADFKRWPSAERDAAQAYAAANRTESERLLFDARMIDAALESVAAPQASYELRQKVIALAPQPRAQRRLRPSAWFWIPSAGIAAACAAGAILGVVAMDRVSATTSTDTVIAANADAGWTDNDLAEIL